MILTETRIPVLLVLFFASLVALPAPALPNGFPHFAVPLDQLFSLLKSADPEQRLGAATSLGIRREPTAVAPLLDVLERPDELEAVKVKVVEALGMIRDPVAVGRLIRQLTRERSAKVRAEIAKVLGELGGERNLPALRTLIESDTSPDVRGRAAIALGRLKAPGARALLEKRLDQELDVQARVAILHGLGLLGDSRALPAVLRLFTGEKTEPVLRRAGALTLGMLGDHQATAPLVDALKAESADVELRQAVALALGQVRDPAAIPALADLLKAPDLVTVVLGIRGLGGTGQKEATGPLLELGLRAAHDGATLARRGSTPEFTKQRELLTIQREVVDALGRLGDPRAWPLLERSLTASQPPPTSVEGLHLRQQLYELRRVAILAVARMPDQQRVMRWLSELVKDSDPKVRAEAARAVGIWKEPEGLALLQIALNDSDPEVRWEAARATGTIKATGGRPALIQALNDRHPRVAVEAARALSALGEGEAIPALEALLRSSQDLEVHAAAAAALEALRR